MERLDDVMRERLRWIARPLRHVELLELGLRGYDVQRLLRRGHLQRAYGRYVTGGLDRHLARAACAQAAHPRSVISHLTAADLTGLRRWTDHGVQPRTDPIWLTCEPGPRRNLKGTDVVLRRAGLSALDLHLHHGLWLTSSARTTVDLARELPLPEAMATIDDALAGSVSPAELNAVLERQYRWPGVRKARAAIALGDPRSESALESYARALFADRGLPPAVLQVEFWDGYRWLPIRVDFWWPEFRTVGEADGLEKFEAATSTERRRLLRRSFERDQGLSDRGLELVHFGWEDAVLHPDDLVRRFEAAFARGSRRAGPEPTWRPAPTTTRAAA